MRAIILVGGLGTRLRPLTNWVPKQMLPIVNKPMIEHVINHLAKFGVSDVILSLGFEPDVFKSAYPEGFCAGVPVSYVIEDEPLDTAGAIAFAATQSKINDTFLVCNGDVITELEINDLFNFHKARGSEATISLTPVEDPARYGVVETDEDGKVLEFIEKPSGLTISTNLINAGVYIMEPSVLDRISSSGPVSVEKETFPSLVSEEKIFAFASDKYWLDAGTPSTYLQANLELINGFREIKFPEKHETAKVDGGAEIICSVLGQEVTVGSGALIRNSVVMEGAFIGEGAFIEGSVIGRGAQIMNDAKVIGMSIVGHGETVISGEVLSGVKKPETIV